MLNPKKIREFRIARGLKVQEVAKGLGIDGAHWHKIETDSNWFPGMKTMVKIARFFDISLDDLARLMGFDIPHRKIVLKNGLDVILELTDDKLCYRHPYTAEVYFYDDENVLENTRLTIKKSTKEEMNGNKRK